MNKIKKVKRTTTYQLTEQEALVIKKFLAGTITTREAGEKLGISHQQVINLVSSLARTWYQKGFISNI